MANNVQSDYFMNNTNMNWLYSYHSHRVLISSLMTMCEMLFFFRQVPPLYCSSYLFMVPIAIGLASEVVYCAIHSNRLNRMTTNSRVKKNPWQKLIQIRVDVVWLFFPQSICIAAKQISRIKIRILRFDR